MNAKHGWLPKDYCPMALRSVAAVLADAVPAKADGGGYRWWQAGGDWWGVDPPRGILPTEIVARLVKYRVVYATVEDAMADLRQACDGLRLDGLGRARA